MSSLTTTHVPGAVTRSFLGRHHRVCLHMFTFIVIVHWMEHVVQAVQIYTLGWPIAEANGVLGLAYPWLVTSEVMHYGYAIVMLVCLWGLRGGFTGRARQWWMLAFAIQFWHHIEHLLLLIQAIAGHNIGGGSERTSVLQFFVPRVELHLFYNTIVTIPMVIGMYFHFRQRPDTEDD